MKYAEVSVVIPCYKSKETIKRAVDSVYQQTLRPYEIILVDDCSPDDSLAELYRVQQLYPDNWVKVIALPENAGPASARNAGWEVATQPYIAFLDADDSWHPQKVEIQYNWMRSHPDAALTGHERKQISCSDGFEHEPINNVKALPISCKRLLLSNYFPTSATMLHRNIALRFHDGRRYCEDYQLWLDICFSGLECYYMDSAPMSYQYKAVYGEDGLSSALWKMEKGELAVYSTLRNRGAIGGGQYVFLSLFSIIKFLKRLLLSQVYTFRKPVN